MIVFKKIRKDISEHVQFLFTIIKDLIEHTISQVHDLNSAFKTDFSIDLGTGRTLVAEYLTDSRDVGTSGDCQTCSRVPQDIQRLVYSQLSKPFQYPNFSRFIL